MGSGTATVIRVAAHVRLPRANYIWVMALSFFGMAARFGTGKLSCYSLLTAAPTPSGVASDGDLEAIVFYDLLANVCGSLVMGLLVGTSSWLQKQYLPVFVGLSTGFCG